MVSIFNILMILGAGICGRGEEPGYDTAPAALGILQSHCAHQWQGLKRL